MEFGNKLVASGQDHAIRAGEKEVYSRCGAPKHIVDDAEFGINLSSARAVGGCRVIEERGRNDARMQPNRLDLHFNYRCHCLHVILAGTILFEGRQNLPFSIDIKEMKLERTCTYNLR
jgi:hypothetical protein